MSNVLFHPSVRQPTRRAISPRRVPPGVGLLIGATASVAMWGGLAWMGWMLFA